uniref:Fiber protein Fb11 n=1 Tax=Setaria italica TaxID=4555 RepID=K3ZAQ2_SETIT
MNPANGPSPPVNGTGPCRSGNARGNGVGPQPRRLESTPTSLLVSIDDGKRKDRKAERAAEAEAEAAAMGVMDKLKIFVVKEPVVAASCLIAGFGLFLPAVVRPILDSWETAEKVPPPPLNDVVAGVTGKKK